MKKILRVLLGAVLLLGGAATAQAEVKLSEDKPNFVLFVSPSCVHCNKLKAEYWPGLKEQYKDSVNFIELDISQGGNNIIFAETAKAYGVQEMGYPAAAIGSTFLMGYPTEIKTYADAAIEKAMLLNEKTTLVQTDAQDPQKAFSKITLWAIIGSGLVDGINPCAFAVIVFFVSFLTVYKYTRKEIIVVGTAYCAAVFAAYVLIGLGLFKFLYAMSGFAYVIKGFYILTAAVCLLFFVLALYDFWVYKKTGKAEKMLLQLPTNLKVRIHKIMGFFLREKHDSSIRLTLAALAVGFAVSLVEAVCTGQVYLPTVVLIMQDPAFRVKAWLFLLLYNLMFIFPLVLIFVLSILGYESKGFNNFLKKHLGLMKLLLCCVFLGLFLLLLGNI
ncbi:hypothetical protein [Candidatus Avelusimicrobium faecicola]|uniref:hypothetical protein n=1 Tax=Candidatus Avelusimicrobium faecicola TaxID=3416205 RepID=UPI003D0FD6D4